jgi:hypothetical protein
MTLVYGAQGVTATTRGQPSQAVTLQAGATWLIPAGTWNIDLGLYSCIQEKDPVQGTWVTNGGSDSNFRYVLSDGVNYRVANLSGCVVGAVVTTAGSGYSTVTPPTISVDHGGCVATAVVGGAVNTSPSVTNGGTNYTYPPLVFLDPPPVGSLGLQATAYATLTSGAVSSITVDNQGSGYTNVPNIYIINDPRDTTGTGASAVATLTAAGTITSVAITNIGTPLTTEPVFTFSSGSAVARPIMVRSIGAYTVTTAGSGYSGAVEISALNSGLTATNVLTNPKWGSNLVRTRKASIIAALSSTSITTTGQTVIDGGIYAGSSPTAIIYGNFTGTDIRNGAVGFTWANNNDTIQIYPV